LTYYYFGGKSEQKIDFNSGHDFSSRSRDNCHKLCAKTRPCAYPGSRAGTDANSGTRAGTDSGSDTKTDADTHPCTSTNTRACPATAEDKLEGRSLRRGDQLQISYHTGNR